ncbi:hypothetical protein ACLB2K_050851 [Fragaria x ananassa]
MDGETATEVILSSSSTQSSPLILKTSTFGGDRWRRTVTVLLCFPARAWAPVTDPPSDVRMLREELQLLQEPGSYVGEVINVMGKNKVLVKVHPEGKYVVDIDKNIDITKITPSTRVALRNDSYVLHLVLPSKVDPLVNLMKVEKVPNSTYDMIGVKSYHRNWQHAGEVVVVEVENVRLKTLLERLRRRRAERRESGSSREDLRERRAR